MLPILPVVHDFLLVGTMSPCMFSQYLVLSHCIASGWEFQKIWKECVLNRLSHPNKSSYSTTVSSVKPETFPMIKKMVFEQLNRFLKDSEWRTSETRSRIHFSKWECGGKLSGCFTENGILGMMEVADYDSIENVPPFLSARLWKHYAENQTPLLWPKYFKVH